MASSTAVVTLELRPKARLDVINVTSHVAERVSSAFSDYPKALYCSYHTTAGFLEQSLCQRLDHSGRSVEAFIHSFQSIFPPDAGYKHDELHLRTELSDSQRCCEPRNADSHLTFIGSGLTNCLTCVNDPRRPVYWVDLDGIAGAVTRRRRLTFLGFKKEVLVSRFQLAISAARHAVDSFNLRDAKMGLFEEMNRLLQRHSIQHGRIVIRLAPSERNAGLTVNEYETLLMKHDLAEVLCNPLYFMAQKGRHIFENPKAVPRKARNYAKYDLVRVVNEFLEVLGLRESLFEKVVDRFLAVPASRFLRMKRSISLLVTEGGGEGGGSIVQGTYQSPILVQWKRAAPRGRQLEVSLYRFD